MRKVTFIHYSETYTGEVMIPFLLRAIVAIFIISVNAAITGTFTVFRNVSFLVAGTAHAALAGAALALILESLGFHVPVLLGGVLFAIFAAISAGYASGRGKVGRREDTNTAIAISFALSMSLAVLFISMVREYAARVWGLLIGDLFLLSYSDLAIMFITTLLVIAITALFYRAFLYLSFDVEAAIASGVKVGLYDYLLLSTIALSVVAIMGGVGAILVFAMFVAPAAIAKRFAKSISHVFLLSFLISFSSGIAGIALSFYLPFSPGAMAAVIVSSTYFVSVFVKK